MLVLGHPALQFVVWVCPKSALRAAKHRRGRLADTDEVMIQCLEGLGGVSSVVEHFETSPSSSTTWRILFLSWGGWMAASAIIKLPDVTLRHKKLQVELLHMNNCVVP